MIIDSYLTNNNTVLNLETVQNADKPDQIMQIIAVQMLLYPNIIEVKGKSTQKIDQQVELNKARKKLAASKQSVTDLIFRISNNDETLTIANFSKNNESPYEMSYDEMHGLVNLLQSNRHLKVLILDGQEMVYAHLLALAETVANTAIKILSIKMDKEHAEEEEIDKFIEIVSASNNLLSLKLMATENQNKIITQFLQKNTNEIADQIDKCKTKEQLLFLVGELDVIPGSVRFFTGQECKEILIKYFKEGNNLLYLTNTFNIRKKAANLRDLENSEQFCSTGAILNQLKRNDQIANNNCSANGSSVSVKNEVESQLIKEKGEKPSEVVANLLSDEKLDEPSLKENSTDNQNFSNTLVKDYEKGKRSLLPNVLSFNNNTDNDNFVFKVPARIKKPSYSKHNTKKGEISEPDKKRSKLTLNKN